MGRMLLLQCRQQRLEPFHSSICCIEEMLGSPTLEGSCGLGCVRMEMLSNTPRAETLFMMRALSLLLKMRPRCHTVPISVVRGP